MVGKIKENRLQIPYVLASILVVVIFFFVSLNVRKNISGAAEEKAGVVAINIARNNIRVVEGVVLEYVKSLEQLKKISALSKFSKEEISGMLEYIANNDTIIHRAWYCEEGGELLLKGKNFVSDDYKQLWNKLYGEKSLFIEASAGIQKGNGVIRIAVPFYHHKDIVGYIGTDISLKGFHDKIAGYSELRSGYITIISDKNTFVLHPDEEQIGKPISENDKLNKSKALVANESFSAEVYSDFLQIDVYRYYNPLIVGDKTWLITANVPNIGLKEYVAKTSKVLLFIAVGALFCFLTIILFGILRWRREFVQRKEAENKNLTLQLRNEQQKKLSIATELENLKSGLNPHFLFNSLSTLKILVNRDAGLSKDFAISLANLYRYLLDHEKENTVSIRTELGFTNDYLYLQKIRFKDSIAVDIDVKDDFMDLLVPPVSVQMLVENCIKHNVVSSANPLFIKIYIKDGNLVVENNFNPRHSLESSTGKGQENLMLRYSFLTDRKCEFVVKDDIYISSIPLL
jgi:hypothetical protein